MADLAQLDQMKADPNKYNHKGELQGMAEKSPRRWYGRLVTKIIYYYIFRPYILYTQNLRVHNIYTMQPHENHTDQFLSLPRW